MPLLFAMLHYAAAAAISMPARFVTILEVTVQHVAADAARRHDFRYAIRCFAASACYAMLPLIYHTRHVTYATRALTPPPHAPLLLAIAATALLCCRR